MKHVRIVLSLLIVVVLAMGGIFFVEGYTTPIIQERLEREANKALYEMFEVDPENPGSFEVSKVTENYPEDTQGTVSEVYEMRDSGQLVGVIYQGNTAGINPGIIFLLAVDSETNNSVAVSILTEAETAGIGKDWLAEQSNLDKYAGQTMEFLRGDSVDTTAGVTLTGNGLNLGIKKALNYHGVAFLGEEAAETPEEMIIRLKSEWFGGSELTDAGSEGNIVEIMETSDGGVFMRVEWTGYSSDPSTYIIGFKDGQVLGFGSVDSTETAGLGYDLVFAPEFAQQFVDQNAGALMTNGVDLVAGSTAAVTLAGINDSLIESIGYYVVEYLGGEAPVVETPEMMVERLKDEWFNGATLTDVYGDYDYNDYIEEVYEADGGYFFKGIYVGFVQTDISSYIMGIKDGKVIGFASVETFETPGIGQTLVEHPDFAAQFAGKDVSSLIGDNGVDYVAGSTAAYTLDGVNESILEVLDFYQKQILGVQDEEAPVLTVNDSRPTTFEVGSEAPNWELYVTGTDNEDDVVVVNNNADTVDFGTAGTYTVTFTATDAAGNEATPVEVVIEITDAPVEFVLIPVPAEVQTVLETMDLSTTDFHDEGITDGLIQGIYTGRDAEGNVTSVFYNTLSSNGTWEPDNSIMVQFTPGTSTIEAINVYINFASYSTHDFAPNTGIGENLDSPLIAAAWAGVDGTGQVTESDLDTVSGTTAEASFPGMIEAIEAVIVYQIDNSIGGAS